MPSINEIADHPGPWLGQEVALEGVMVWCGTDWYLHPSSDELGSKSHALLILAPCSEALEATVRSDLGVGGQIQTISVRLQGRITLAPLGSAFPAAIQELTFLSAFVGGKWRNVDHAKKSPGE